VSLGRTSEALLAAERARCRALADLLEQRRGMNGNQTHSTPHEASPASLRSLLAAVDRQKASVLYYSLAAGCLFSWCIVPEKGVVR
jgi:hypothetical protein